MNPKQDDRKDNKVSCLNICEVFFVRLKKEQILDFAWRTPFLPEVSMDVVSACHVKERNELGKLGTTEVDCGNTHALKTPSEQK